MTVYTGQKNIKKIMDNIAKSKYGFDTSIQKYNSLSKVEQKKVKCIKTNYKEMNSAEINKFLVEGFKGYLKKKGGNKK